MPLLSFEMQPVGSSSGALPDIDEDPRDKKKWTAYLLFCLVLFLIFAPQPSIVIVLTRYYLLVSQARLLFLLHLGVSYFLLFVMLSSLIVCIVRDPGPVKPEQEESDVENTEAATEGVAEGDGDDQGDGMSFMDALLAENPPSHNISDDGFSLTPRKANGERRWCRKCWAPKPERTHHCSVCNRCVLKMDHHCPWLANRCVGARTYPSFLQFLFSTTMYCAYMFGVCIPPLKYYLSQPFYTDDIDYTPFHVMTLALMGCIFSLSIGSFLTYHIWLTITNQTTLESLTPYLLLRYLSSIPPPSADPTDPTQNVTNRVSTSSTYGIPAPSYDADFRPPSFSSSAPASPTSESSSTSLPSPTIPPHSPPPYARTVPYSSSRSHPTQRTSRVFEEHYQFPSPPLTPTLLPRQFAEHQLNSKQRRAVREAAGRIRLYDLGWKENIKEVMGGPAAPNASSFRTWMERILWGGRGRGDAHSYRHSRRAQTLLRELADELVALDS